MAGDEAVQRHRDIDHYLDHGSNLPFSFHIWFTSRNGAGALLLATRRVQNDCGADQPLQGGFVQLVTFMEVNSTSDVPVKTRVEETFGIPQRGALGEGHFHYLLVGLASADNPVVGPDRRAHPLPFLHDVRISLLDEFAYLRK